MRKYTAAEKAQVLTPAQNERIGANLNSIGKTSARDLTAEERQAALDTRSTK
jgi:hypothetical protein